MHLFERHHNVQPCSLQTFDGLRAKRVNMGSNMCTPERVLKDMAGGGGCSEEKSGRRRKGGRKGRRKRRWNRVVLRKEEREGVR